jgi:predicted aldo/keto reductase-like oxidoreductase
MMWREPMQYRRLGRTGLEISCVGFGALPLTGLNEEEASAVLNAALDAHMNFIDTARGYRESEDLIGKSVAARRKEYFLATKTRARREDRIREELETSLRYLQTNHIDLYQVHYVNTEEELRGVLSREGALSVLQKIRNEGICDHVGITGHDAAVLLEAAKTGEFDTIQGAFSYIEKEQKTLDLIDYCHGNDIGFIDQKPLAGGAIVPVAAGLKWLLGHPVSTVIPGMITVEQVVENAAVGSGKIKITEQERNDLDRLVQSLGQNFCRRCNYCQPACPQNIRIGVILEFYGKARIPENFALSQRWYRGFEVNGSDCTECGACLSECPYGLPIPDMLGEAHALLH